MGERKSSSGGVCLMSILEEGGENTTVEISSVWSSPLELGCSPRGGASDGVMEPCRK